MRGAYAAMLVCTVAAVAGAALWSRPAGAEQKTNAPSTEAAATWPGAAEDLGRALLLLLDDRRRAAMVVSDRLHANLLLGSAVPPAALGAAAGAPVDAAAAGEREIVQCLLRLADARLAATVPDGLHAAWAGSLRTRGPFLLRLHAPSLAME